MKNYFLIGLTALNLLACNADDKTVNTDSVVNPYADMDTATEAPSFFPVTNYILGQIEVVKKEHPQIKYYQVNDAHTDSMIIDSKKFDFLINEFKLPVIDSLHYSVFFTEKKFNDESIGLTTFTYDPSEPLPDSIPWKRWDVYIDPESAMVKRVYLIKELSPKKILQLTWLPERECRIVMIDQSSDGSKVKIGEKVFKWTY